MPSQVEEIKQKIDIVELINKSLPLKKRGRHHIACCPFHSEKTPSFTVSPELQIFKCFGCGKSGDIFTFYQEYHRLEFTEALEELAKIAGVKLVRSSGFTKAETIKKNLLAINQEVAKFYHYILTQHQLGKPVLDYLKDRGISSESIKLFQIGYSPQNSDLILNYLKKKNFPLNDLIASGTFGQSQYSSRIYDRFSDRLTFPLVDYRNQILGFSGRILPFSQNQKSAKYINSPETDIYHKSQMLFGLNLSKDEIRNQNSVLVTEGEFDMIAPYQAGFKNIVALKGTAFTQDQLQLLRRYTDTLILALDSDFAGNNAAQKSIELADSFDFDIRVLTLSDKYKDPDEAIQKDLPHFKQQLKKTIPIWDFIISSSIKNFGIDSPKAKKQVLQNVLPFLVKINNSVIRSDYLRLFASEIGSDYEALLQEVKKLAQPSVNLPPPLPDKYQEAPPTQVQRLQQYLLTLVIAAKKPTLLAKKLEKYLQHLHSPTQQKILSLLLTHKNYQPESFQTSLPAELQPTFQDLYLKATSQELSSELRSKEVKKTVHSIQELILKQEITQLAAKIAKIDNDSDPDLLKEVELEYNKKTADLSRLQSKKD